MLCLPPKEYYVFREAQNVMELKSLLQLRYRGYHQSRCTALIDRNDTGLDLDYYDLQSRHMGFFHLQGRESIPLGYMRLIEDDLTKTAPLIWQLAANHNDLVQKLENKPKGSLPFLSISPDNTPLERFYEEAKDKGHSMVEGSRFVFDTSVRSRGFPKFVLESAVAVTLFSQGFEYAMLGCLPRHGTFYKRFGFHAMEGYEDFPYGTFRSCILKNTKASVPSIIKGKIQKMADAYSTTGIICHFPENKEQFSLPVEDIASAPVNLVLS